MNLGYTNSEYVAYYDETVSEAEIVVDSQATADESCVNRRLVAAKIEVEQGTPQHRTVILSAAVCPIGREASNPLCIPDNRMSRSHAVITHQGGGFWVKDTGSRNGTYINNEPCTELTPIFTGDTIQFGKSLTMRAL